MVTSFLYPNPEARLRNSVSRRLSSPVAPLHLRSSSASVRAIARGSNAMIGRDVERPGFHDETWTTRIGWPFHDVLLADPRDVWTWLKPGFMVARRKQGKEESRRNEFAVGDGRLCDVENHGSVPVVSSHWISRNLHGIFMAMSNDFNERPNGRYRAIHEFGSIKVWCNKCGIVTSFWNFWWLWFFDEEEWFDSLMRG